MKRKIVALFVAVMFVISMITGCAKKVGDTSVLGTTEATQTKADDTGTGTRKTVTAKDGTVFYETDLPIVDKPVSFTIWGVTTAADPTKFPMCKIYEEDTGISPKWVTVSADSLKERKNIMWASGEYPDVLGPGVVTDADIDTHGPMGIIIPLNNFIEKYLVNFKEYSGDHWESIWKKVTYPDGNIYTYPTSRMYYLCDSAVPSINTAWLEKLGLKMPTTPDEFVAVLRAFKTKDPNGNNKADEIPLTATWGSLGRLFDLAGWTGVITSVEYIENGQVVWPLKSAEVKEAVKWLHSIYAEGLMDPEIFTQDSATFTAKGKQADLVYGVACNFREGNTVGDAASKNYFVMEPLKGSSGKQLAYGTKDKFLVQSQFCVTSACKVPEIVARWVDYMYDPMISLQSNLAPISAGGVIPHSDGTYEKSIPKGFSSLSEYYVDNHFQQVPRLCLEAYDKLLWVNPETYIPFKFASEGTGQKKLHDDIRGPYVIDRMPSVKPLKEETETLSLILTDFNKYYTEMLTRFITGQADIELEWDNYCAQLDKLGYDKVLKIRQQQYERFIGK